MSNLHYFPSSPKGAVWFNCNPDSPKHWFYTEWITNKDRDFKHLHFLMKDNPTLGKAEIKRAESVFSGVFYDRYILGKWVRAEGAVFLEFAADPTPHINGVKEIIDMFVDKVIVYAK